MEKNIKRLLIIIIILAFINIGYLVYKNIYAKKYSNEDFEIETYTSLVDYDNDGLDDQSDILLSAREYVATSPYYKSVYYETGYSTDNYGVCTDVIAFALLGSGYDLMTLVNEDILSNQSDYNIEEVDINIDFRRVSNLLVYFENTAISLTTDIYDIDQWQGGDIVIFEDHIGIVSDIRNSLGVTYVIHHSDPYQLIYEEDILTTTQSEIIGHYRVS